MVVARNVHDAYRHGRFCVVPALVVYEPNYESGTAMQFAIANADGAPLAIAGIWEHRPRADGALVLDADHQCR